MRTIVTVNAIINLKFLKIQIKMDDSSKGKMIQLTEN